MEDFEPLSLEYSKQRFIGIPVNKLVEIYREKHLDFVAEHILRTMLYSRIEEVFPPKTFGTYRKKPPHGKIKIFKIQSKTEPWKHLWAPPVDNRVDTESMVVVEELMEPMVGGLEPTGGHNITSPGILDPMVEVNVDDATGEIPILPKSKSLKRKKGKRKVGCLEPIFDQLQPPDLPPLDSDEMREYALKKLQKTPTWIKELLRMKQLYLA